MTRIVLQVEVNLDGTGYGTFGTVASAVKVTEAILNQSIEHYNPKVTDVRPVDNDSDSALAVLRYRLGQELI